VCERARYTDGQWGEEYAIKYGDTQYTVCKKKKESKKIKASTNGIFNLLESTLNRNYISWEPIYLHDLFGDLFIDSKLLFDLGAHSHTQAHWFYSPFTLLIFKFSLHFAQFM